MDTIITIGRAYGIPAHILAEYCSALDVGDCFDGLSPKDAETAATVIAVTVAALDDPAKHFRQRAANEADPAVARAYGIAAAAW